MKTPFFKPDGHKKAQKNTPRMEPSIALISARETPHGQKDFLCLFVAIPSG
ncbi:hypothetical protein OPIT5_01890 [Opitutaceae bacterium TAV5]|nr:hypothetical protein OPIT5_01890 [Opitutaceae bacterium TAV5]